MSSPERQASSGELRVEDTAAIRSDIERTRARLGATVEALGAQLNPSHLAQRAKDGLREATIGKVQHMASQTKERLSEGGRGLAETIRENPLPAAMAAAGIGWLLLRGRERPSPARYYDGEEIERTHGRQDAGAGARIRELASSVGERMHDVTDKARETGQRISEKADSVAHKARETGHRISEKADSVAHSVKERSRMAADRVEHRFEENPLALGGVALALGMAVGMSLPRTRREVEMLGDKRDSLMEKAREQVATATQKVEGVVEKVMPEVQSVVKDAAREEGLIR